MRRLAVGGGILVVLAGLAFHWQVRRVVRGSYDDALRNAAQAVASLTEQRNCVIDLDFVRENLPQFERADGPEICQIRDWEGREVKRSPSLGTVDLPRRTGSAESPHFFDWTMPDGRVMRCAALRFRPLIEEEGGQAQRPEAPVRELDLVMGRDRSGLDRTLRLVSASLGGVGALLLLGLVGLVRREVRQALAPLDDLGRKLAAVEVASLGTRFPPAPWPDELRPVVDRLNDLLERLQRAFERERRFTSAAAHELRTPLAELRALAEVSLGTPGSEAEQHESWEDALASVARMEATALRLLELARANREGMAVRPEGVAWAEALARAWRPWEETGRRRGLRLETGWPEEAMLRTDRILLDSILGNLCANVAHHAPEGSLCRIEGILTGGMWMVTFRNPAPALTPADLPRLFEPFWRKDPATGGGHGLGLALAAGFARILGGTLEGELGPGENLTLTLRLPQGRDEP